MATPYAHMLGTTACCSFSNWSASTSDSTPTSSTNIQNGGRSDNEGGAPSISHREPPTNRGRAHYGISRSNIGFRMLRKAGWSEGEGIGVNNQASPWGGKPRFYLRSVPPVKVTTIIAHAPTLKLEIVHPHLSLVSRPTGVVHLREPNPITHMLMLRTLPPSQLDGA
eukprot:804247-Prorocentrum_minimum.AAC.2